ncbi:MAG TPA: serine/threonine-protein kinase, partial [Polyangiaceae bacterium]
MSSPVTPGTVLAGKYRVDRVLGEGGMGIVVLATDEQLERRVAIKFLLPEYTQHPEAAQRFLREARACVKIQSEHVARVIDVGTLETGSPYMVMEYLQGRDLSAVIEEGPPLAVEDAVAHVLEACDAIAEAHSVGIVHRDLKPANLFLANQPDGSTRIKVLDFGISKATMTTATGGVDHSLTRTSSMMGSPLYMSPEQMKSAKNVDPRTDVWALGVILYELLTGKPPFYAESIPELSAKVLLEEPVSIRSLRADVPEALEAVVKRALSKDTASRYPTVADLAGALAQFGPARTRANVERASKVLKISGHALTPAPLVPLSVKTDPGAAHARTAAAWTDSGAPGSQKKEGKGRGAVIFGGIAAVVVMGGVAIFAMSNRGGTGASGGLASSAPPPVAVATPVAEPKPVAEVAALHNPEPAAPSAPSAPPSTSPAVAPMLAAPLHAPAKPGAALHAKPSAKPKA